MMKTNKILSFALIAALALAAAKASADLVLSVSGAAVVEKSNENLKATTENYSLNNKVIYSIIAHALDIASNASYGAISSTNVPADGYLAFNPTNYDGEVVGTFYVTNKTGFYCPLSGFDASSNYYSFVELDTQSYWYDFLGFQFGFVNDFTNGAPFNGPSAFNLTATGSGTETDQSTALLYIHDDGYAYDDADYPSIYWANYLDNGGTNDFVGFNGNAVEIRGILKATLDLKMTNVTGASFSLTGSGNFVYQDAPNSPYANIVKSATARLAK